MVRRALALSIFSLIFMIQAGCNQNDDESSSTPYSDTRYEQGETLSASWCMTAQMHLAALNGTFLDETKIDQTVPASTSDLTLSKAAVHADEEQPIRIVAFAQKMSNTSCEDAPDTLSTHIICKMKSQEGIEHGLSTEIPGEEGTCQEINQMAIDWAVAQLSKEEQAKYADAGKQLALAGDLLGISGSTWYGTQSKFTREGGTYFLASSALVVPYDIAPGFPEELRGVHYCKLLAPSQVLYWMLNRAFWEDPLGGGPSDDDGAALVDEGGCAPTQTSARGSCIFLFEVSQQHYCEEYIGTQWTPASAEERCAERKEGVFLNSSCSERENETSQLDGDGVYKGVCLINCGTDEEYRWHVYSEPVGDTPIDQYCQDWFPVA